MTPDRHRQIMELFAAALEQPAETRAAWLARTCGRDLELRREVESLLACDHTSGALDCPPLGRLVDPTQVAASEPPAAPVPQQIGKFEILGLLGSGGMGVVYRARQEHPSRVVALKLIRPDVATAASHRRFQTEMETLARLRHPGIAAIYEAGTVTTVAGNQPYIAMEYVTGPPVLAYAAAQRLDQRARVALLARLCDALEHAHRRGVIHRDLKPANILVEEIDGAAQPRVLDFGVARLTDREAPAATTVTMPGQVVGTLAYMSPEQMDGDPHALDTRSDVYSLGVIGYELLCGALPIDVSSSSLYAAVRTVRDTPPRPLYEHNRHCHGDLNTIILKALAKDRDQRYDSAALFAGDLRRYLAGDPIAARPPSALYVMRKWAARHRALVAGVLLVLLCLLGGIAGTSYGLIQARRSQARLEQRIRQMTDTAAFLAQEVTANLGPVAGTTNVRRGLLERLSREVDDLLRQSPTDERLLCARAAVLTQQSDIGLSEDRRDAALALRSEALALYERLAAAQPADPERQADLSIAMVKIGDVHKAQDHIPEARSWYEKAAAIDEELMRTHPETRRYLDNLAWSCDRLSELAQQNREMDRARAYLLRRQELNQRLLSLDPDSLTTLHGIWETWFLLGRMETEPATRLRYMTDALRAAERLVQADPHNRLYNHACVTSHIDYAVCLSPGDLAKAGNHLDEAIRLADEYTRLEPADIEGYGYVFNGLTKRGHLALAMGDLATARTMSKRAAALYDGTPFAGRPISGTQLAALDAAIAAAGSAATQSAPEAPTPSAASEPAP